MLQLLCHHCPFCSRTTDVPATASVFSEPQHCNSCGHSSLFTPDTTTMNASREQDQLSNLFAAHMSLSHTPPPEQHAPPAPKNIFPSAHYTPTRHMVPIRFSPPPEIPEQIPDNQIMFFLTGQATLSSWTHAQSHNLAMVPPEQRLQLLKQWGHVRKEFYLPEASSTLHSSFSNENLHDPFANNNVAPFPRPASCPETRPSPEAEPYMASGYEMLARREYEDSTKQQYVQATDPAWAGRNDVMEF